MAISDIGKAVPIVHSAALVGYASKLAKKKKKKAGDFVKVATGSIVGAALIAEESKFLNSWD